MKLKLAVAAIGLAFSVPAFADSAGVYQSGTDNYANVDQTSSGAGAYVSQQGDRNHVGFDYRPYGYDFQSPGISQYYVNSGFASVQQTGNDNSAWVYQYYGDNQNVSIQQGGWRWNGESWTDYGNGNYNYASFGQYAWGGANQSIDVFQAGTGNSAWGNQSGSNNSMNVTQNGWYNYAAGLYQGGSDNQMTVTQNGTNTVYYVNQYGTGGEANVMNINQNGSGNFAGYGVYQSGAGNNMGITQDGSYNTVYYASQYGNNNSLAISQTGTGHYAWSNQYGSGNAAVITQR